MRESRATRERPPEGTGTGRVAPEGQALCQAHPTRHRPLCPFKAVRGSLALSHWLAWSEELPNCALGMYTILSDKLKLFRTSTTWDSREEASEGWAAQGCGEKGDERAQFERKGS